jgi:hypothetical protein
VPKHHTKKTFKDGAAKLHTFLTLTLDINEWDNNWYTFDRILGGQEVGLETEAKRKV